MPKPPAHRHQPRTPTAPPVQAYTTTLTDIFLHHTTASTAITTTLHRHPTWNQSDKARFATTTYDLIRNWRLLWHLQDQQPTIREHDIQHLLTTYQLYKKTIATPHTPTPLQERLNHTTQNRALRESVPDWLDTLCAHELGPRWDSVLHALNTPPTLTIRTNTLKTTRPKLILSLKKEGIHTTPLTWAPDALTVQGHPNLFQLPAFQAGLFEVQDAASQLPARLLDPQPGSRVVDACAGEGGKTLHLAALMHNTGRIIALDPSPHHLQELRRRATRAGADNIETRLLTSAKTTKRLTGTIDRLLIDAPCSGLGTLQHNPDIKWKLTAEALDRLKTLQHELLETYHPLLKPSGRLLYSVCSILPSEGEHQTKALLNETPGLHLLKEQRCWPDTDHTDGFYMALLERTK